MAQMTHCSGCQKHYFSREDACPHCGGTGRTGPVRAFVRQAKMGGLMLFTALTTTACYGTPASMIEGPNGALPPGVAEPMPKVPAVPGVAYAFLTAEGAEAKKRTFELGQAKLEGRMLTLVSARGTTLITLGVEDAAALEPAEGVQETIPLSGIGTLTVNLLFEDRTAMLVKSPGEISQGYLQIARLDDETIGGTLRLEKDGQVFDFYFHARR